MNHRTVMSVTLLATCLPAASGCGPDEGPDRFHVSGKVVHDGAAVPGGRIVFAPDASKGNSGPGAVADIQNGRYVTRPGRGATAGPQRVTIYGTDGSQPTETHDNSLFPPYTLDVDLPPQATEVDFEVPRKESIDDH